MVSSVTPSYRLVNTKGRSPRIFFGVAVHYVQGGVYLFGDVDLVDDQKVGFGDAGAAFSRNFVAAGDVDHLQGEVRQFQAEGGRKVVDTGPVRFGTSTEGLR